MILRAIAGITTLAITGYLVGRALHDQVQEVVDWILEPSSGSDELPDHVRDLEGRVWALEHPVRPDQEEARAFAST